MFGPIETEQETTDQGADWDKNTGLIDLFAISEQSDGDTRHQHTPSNRPAPHTHHQARRGDETERQRNETSSEVKPHTCKLCSFVIVIKRKSQV